MVVVAASAMLETGQRWNVLFDQSFVWGSLKPKWDVGCDVAGRCGRKVLPEAAASLTCTSMSDLERYCRGKNVCT